eukprot:TRINITY_DN69469_c0_g1_i1.p1 TRINITY_DN69469_c0_g1~~TRINITY_DN69469_c0_g1_i1.p1  ORF type:complete len:450 (+),score=67.70 TRINITY_DN69469_c0_g1_i1:66-1352(+)
MADLIANEEPFEKKIKVQHEVAAAETHLDVPKDFSCRVLESSSTSSLTIKYEDIASGLNEMLAQKGVAIVTGILDAADIVKLQAALKQDLEELIDMNALAKADDSVRDAWERVGLTGLNSWPQASLKDMGGLGRFQNRGLPHGRFAWMARTHPKVRRVYELIHGTTDLVSSCDNSFVSNHLQSMAVTNSNWPHVDQNDNETRFPCKEWDVYQGLLYVWSSESAHASTTVVWPESHKSYDDYVLDPNIKRRISEGKPHFSPIRCLEPGAARDRLIRGWEEHSRRMPVPAGGLLLWSSRTTHQGWSGGPRLAQPVCWEPRDRCDALMRERKLRLAALGLPSTHWASLALPHELSDLCRDDPVDAVGAADHEGIRFPLRRSIRSQALDAKADPEEIWRRLQAPASDWFAPLAEETKAFLEASISDTYKEFF